MSRCMAFVLACALALCASQSYGGYLATDTSSYFDGFTQWNGSTPFDDGGGLTGYIDWAVYAPGTFPGSFTGYAPNPAELVYTYQLFSTGTNPLSYFSVALDGEGYDADYFTGSGVSASVDGDVPLTSDVFSNIAAIWTFAGIDPPGSSKGLVFTSPMVPMDGLGIVQDGGPATFAFPIPSTSPFNIPEPASWVLALFGLAGLSAASFIRRRRRVRA